MDTWERFSEISLPSKEDFYSNLNMEDINDIDYRHATNVFKRFKLENLEITTIYTYKTIHYYYLMYLIILEICVLKSTN